jgi:hypothetical protein
VKRNRPHAPFATPFRRGAAACALAVAALASTAAGRPAPPPATLAETGLYADFATRKLAPRVMSFEPQYPLWTDGATKRRWIQLPPGATIDASDADVWHFPVGTKAWKEFAFAGHPVETRFIERLADGSWRFAAYAWNADATAATLAPAAGVRAATQSAPGIPYDIPGTADCRACHGGHPSTVLGFSALQLSSDRDPLAPHAATPAKRDVDLRKLVSRGVVVGLPAAIAAHPPRVSARTPSERAVLGYLHGNCSHCHNTRGPLADLGLYLSVSADGIPDAFPSALAQPAPYRPAGAAVASILAPGDDGESLLVRRLATRDPLLQMPPLGTRAVDGEALALVAEWIRSELAAPASPITLTAAAHAAALSEENLP